MFRETTFTIHAADGTPLDATLIAPEGAATGPSVLINSAVGVPRKIYQPFARMLAVRGATVLLYDYRGIGGSRPDRLAGHPARLRDWALLDAAAAADHLLRDRPDQPLVGLGHSFGGQAFALMPNADRFARVATVAAQSGYWRLAAPRERWRVYGLLKLVVPTVAAVAGYVPARRFKLGEDLPLGVFREWRRWCLSPNYFYDDPTLGAADRARRLRADVLAVGLSDDAWATPEAIDRLVAGFTAARVTRRTMTPEEAGVKRLGHFAFFRADHQKTLWPEVADWLLAV